MSDKPLNKTCWKCRVEFPIDNFCRNGADNVCKPCRYKLNAEWASANREKLRPGRAEYMRQYRERKKSKVQDTPPTAGSDDPEPKPE